VATGLALCERDTLDMRIYLTQASQQYETTCLYECHLKGMSVLTLVLSG